jgi:tyrosine-protein phosphatase SIW14
MHSPYLSMVMTALVLSGGAVTGFSAQSPRTYGANDRPPLAIAQKKVIAGLPNFGEVTPTLYRGAQPTEQGLSKLKEMEFDIVVDFRANPGAERQAVTSLGMEYVAIPWTCDHPEDRDIAMFIALLRAHPGKKIFVHCRDGIDRTGMEIAAFRIVEQGWSDADARREMEAFGFSRFHRAICMALVPYEANFVSRFHASPAFEALRVQPPSVISSPTK